MGLIKNAAVIDLSNRNLTKIPDEIFTYKNLQKLILRNNKIRTIPKEITSLKRLRMIDLSNNKIDVLYAKLFSLENLEALYLNQNNLKTLPPQIMHLKKLRRIGLSGNKLKTLPKEFTELSNLEFLNISNNSFEEFPLEVLSLKNLKSLRVSNNNFKSFPSDRIIKELVSLNSLYCYSTHINQLKTPETNRDYLLLAGNTGNCLRKLKGLLELFSASTILLEPIKKKAFPAAINKIKSRKGLTSDEKISSNKNIVFICYSHQDEKWRKEVEISIEGMHYEGLDVDAWSDKRIRTSTKWRDEIFEVLSKAKIAVLLISKYFLASSFIRNQELPKIIERAANDELNIMNLIISYCRFEENKELSQYEALNTPDTPLLSLTKDKRDFILLKLTREIEYFINQ